MMDTPNKRLQWARNNAGFRTPTDAARALGKKESTYLGHENGSRGFKNEAATYARKFKVTLDWLLDGRGEPHPGYSETEAALIEAFRLLPPAEADAYLRLIQSRAHSS